jgi:AraC family transcriptional regulator of adaptative response/methylated-DNA-[protein]-cysteine methyltransferase
LAVKEVVKRFLFRKNRVDAPNGLSYSCPDLEKGGQVKASDYTRIEKAIHYLAGHPLENPSLEQLSRAAGLSPFHFQRLFKRWAGVSPKQFTQFLTAQAAKQKLLESRNLLDAAYDAGLSSPGRLHDLLVSVEAMSPGEYKKRGEGLMIRYGIHPSPFGPCLIALTDRGICGLSFLSDGKLGTALKELRKRWPKADFTRDDSKTKKTAQSLFALKKGRTPPRLRLFLKGTPFQLKVWEALLRIPAGAVLSYQDVAGLVGKPKASRAVGSAVARNPIGYLIPCHRVIRETGVLGEYHWGAWRKKAILGWEAVRVQERISMKSDKELTSQLGLASSK